MWVNEYKPNNLSEYVGQKEPVDTFLKWIKNWKPGKSLLFHGPPGTGKTCLVETFSKENNYEFIELNASDFRAKRDIENVLGQSMKQSSLFGRKKIFLIDEIDGLAGRKDMGGVGAIIQIIKESRFPVVLTCNNPYDGRLRTLKEYCQSVQFKKLTVFDIEKKLRQIADNESVKIDKEISRQLAKRADGDLRSAIIDFESIAYGKKDVKQESMEILGYREREQSIFDAIMMIFKTKSALASKLAINNVDKDPEEIFWWIENNIANEYEDPEEIAKAYDALSKADLFRQRIKSRQNWKFLAYMIDLMTGGVSVSKKEMYKKFTRYQYPSNISILGGSKFERKEEKDKLLELSQKLHCSTRKIRKEFLPFLSLFKYSG
ncbi:MAG: replication factor C large subunit [Candidatus Aenigmarchaeota archaeon]|nr:replication factor C large subunit [Candidatus Aenigmarchaeota archaeon]